MSPKALRPEEVCLIVHTATAPRAPKRPVSPLHVPTHLLTSPPSRDEPLSPSKPSPNKSQEHLALLPTRRPTNPNGIASQAPGQRGTVRALAASRPRPSHPIQPNSARSVLSHPSPPSPSSPPVPSRPKPGSRSAPPWRSPHPGGMPARRWHEGRQAARVSRAYLTPYGLETT